jgi:hypothetical protein
MVLAVLWSLLLPFGICTRTGSYTELFTISSVTAPDREPNIIATQFFIDPYRVQ